MQYEMRGRGQHRRHIYKMCFATVDKPSINVYYLSDMLVMNISTCFTKSMLESLVLNVAKVMREVGGRCEQMKMSSPPLSTLSENVKMSLLHFNQNVLHRTLWSFSLFSRSIADAPWVMDLMIFTKNEQAFNVRPTPALWSDQIFFDNQIVLVFVLAEGWQEQRLAHTHHKAPRNWIRWLKRFLNEDKDHKIPKCSAD